MKHIQLAFMSIVLQVLGVFLGKFILKNSPNELEEMTIEYLDRIMNLLEIIQAEGKELDNNLN